MPKVCFYGKRYEINSCNAKACVLPKNKFIDDAIFTEWYAAQHIQFNGARFIAMVH